MSWFWPVLLIAAAGVSLGFVIVKVRRRRLAGFAAAGAILFRVGLIAVGIVYLAALPYRAPSALYAALGLAALGAVLNLVSAFGGRRHERA